ncbi:bi-domain-containing oxidoreductase [Planktomarina temperata]|nr:bi-domain-containing oxidoreductase [Planktomarina temperata]
MKQLLQSLKDGTTEIADVPAPQSVPGKNLIKTSTSLVSAGTERMLIQFGKSNLIQKAKSQPDKVKMVLDKAKTDGVSATLDAVKTKLDQPLELGYCNVGTILEGCDNTFSVGDRVVSNGKHAEIVSVSKNLCAKIPDNVSDEAAAFTVLASIGLQGIRLANPTLGETFVVTGLGLIGLLTVQMLRANGCKVLGIDYDQKRLDLAESFGAETVNPNTCSDILGKARAFSNGQGVDAVIITASTQSNEPIAQAAKMCRQRGRIVLIGVVGLQLNRADFYEKEISFQVSCSYGPGRYDPEYEEKGQDYPIGYVRWTEQRNFEAVLSMLSSGAIKVDPLISHRYEITDGKEAMSILTSNKAALGILLNYSDQTSDQLLNRRVVLFNAKHTNIPSSSKGNVAFLGAGNYATGVLIPAFKSAGAHFHSVSSNGGVSALHAGRKFAFKEAVTDNSVLFDSELIDIIIIATRHHLHAKQVLRALKSQKHVFCEKPLCLTHSELKQIKSTSYENKSLQLMVGFNRRFAPQVVKMKELLSTINEPLSIIITVNAGHIPGEHWTQNPEIGGGRMIGEGCHFIDLARHLVGSSISHYDIKSIGKSSGVEICDDKFTVSLGFSDGSFASINYLANGHKAFPKERIEIFGAGKVLQLDNFRLLKGWGWPGFKALRLWRQDKGQKACAEAFMKSVRHNTPAPITKEELFEVSSITIDLAELLRK